MSYRRLQRSWQDCIPRDRFAHPEFHVPLGAFSGPKGCLPLLPSSSTHGTFWGRVRNCKKLPESNINAVCVQDRSDWLGSQQTTDSLNLCIHCGALPGAIPCSNCRLQGVVLGMRSSTPSALVPELISPAGTDFRPGDARPKAMGANFLAVSR